MKTRISRTLAAFGAALIAASAEAPPQPAASQPDDGGVQQWTDRSGKTIDAHFVALSANVLTLSDKQGEKKVSISRLSPASQAQARRLARLIGVYQPIRNGRFTSGSPAGETGRSAWEVQRMVLTSAFWMKATEVTWTEWNAVRKFAELYGYTDIGTGNNGTRGLDADLNPVVEVTWWDAVKWCNLKSQLAKLKPVYYAGVPGGNVFKIGTGEIQADWKANGYRLPTEAEWEFACRTRDTKWQFHTGPIGDDGPEELDENLDKAGWYAVNSGGEPHRVALKDSNNFGLFDMHGNAAEWCWDVPTVWSQIKAVDPRGPVRGDHRTIRGGSWADPAVACRAAARASLTPGATPERKVGFRIVRNLEGEKLRKPRKFPLEPGQHDDAEPDQSP